MHSPNASLCIPNQKQWFTYCKTIWSVPYIWLMKSCVVVNNYYLYNCKYLQESKGSAQCNHKITHSEILENWMWVLPSTATLTDNTGNNGNIDIWWEPVN